MQYHFGMGSLIRTLLIWLLVLAVPAQGAAAVTMAFCGPNHHSTSGCVDAEAVASPQAHHADAPACHGHQANVTALPGSAGDGAASDQAAKQTCSACAACCSLGAILTTVPAVPATDSAPTVFTTVVPTVDAFAAGGPDRPPRSILA